MNQVKEQAGDALATARESVGHATDRVREGYHDMQSRVEHTIQERPALSLGAAFGLGVLAGVGLSLLLFTSEQESATRRYSRQAEQFGRKFWDSIAQNWPDSLSRHG